MIDMLTICGKLIIGTVKEFDKIEKDYNDMVDTCDNMYKDNDKLLKENDAMSRHIEQFEKALSQAIEDKKRMADAIFKLRETLIDGAARADGVLEELLRDAEDKKEGERII